jgi:hypothetical protein
MKKKELYICKQSYKLNLITSQRRRWNKKTLKHKPKGGYGGEKELIKKLVSQTHL